jgi:hypothetical protein
VVVLALVLEELLGVLEGDLEEGGEVGPGLVPVEPVLLAPPDPGAVLADEPAEGDALDPGDVGEVLAGEADLGGNGTALLVVV